MKVGALFLDLLRKPIHPQYGVLSSWDLSREEVVKLKTVAIQEVMGAVVDPSIGLEWLAKVLGMDSRDPVGNPPKRSEIAFESIMERLARGGNSFHLLPLHPQDEAVLTSPALIGVVASTLIRSGAMPSKQKALSLLEAAAVARLPPQSNHLLTDEVLAHCAEAAAVAGDPEMVTRLMVLLYRFHGALASGRGREPRNGSRAARNPFPSLRQAWGRFRAQVGLPRGADAEGRPGASLAPAIPLGGDADAAFERSAIRLLKSVVRAVLDAPPSPLGRPLEAFPAAASSSLAETDPSPLASLEEALGVFRALRGATSWGGVVGMAIELLRRIARLQQPARARARGPSRSTPSEAVSMRALSRAEVARLGGYALDLLEVVRRGIPASHAERLLPACVELGLQGCVPGIARILQSPLGGMPFAAPIASVFPVVDPTALLGVFPEAFGEGMEKGGWLPYALAAAIRLLAERVDLAREGGGTATEPRDSPTDRPSPLRQLRDHFRDVQTPLSYIARAGTTPAEGLTGGLLLFLALMLAPGHWEDPWTAAFTSEICGGGERRDGGSRLARIRQIQHDWLSLAAEGPRRWLWHLLRSDYAHRLREAGIPEASTGTPFPSAKGFPPPHLHQALKANTALMCGIVGNPAREGHPPESGELARVLYRFGIAPSDFPHVDHLLSRWMGFPIQTTPLTRGINENGGANPTRPDKKRSSRSSPVELAVVISVGTLEKLHPPPCPPGEDWEVGFFERLTQQTLRPWLPSSCEAFHLTFILTYDGLRYLQRGIAAAEEGRGAADLGGFSTALLAKLQGGPSMRETPGYRCCVAAPHTLPRGAFASMFSMDGEGACLDGAAEACFLAHQFRSTPHRTAEGPIAEVFFWNEDEGAMREAAPTTPRLLEANHVRVVSVRRAQIQKAKHVIFQLLQNPPLPSSAGKLSGARIQRFSPSVEGRTFDGVEDRHDARGGVSSGEQGELR
ncbi:unnamed protein product [Phytomonas sp. EM1]|nr:unnamed protein product [Phytomonas sp. EM1]|eukprot:CCW60132.1 unnamed protein product [Phytomonas sp. isolate EM1]